MQLPETSTLSLLRDIALSDVSYMPKSLIVDSMSRFLEDKAYTDQEKPDKSNEKEGERELYRDGLFFTRKLQLGKPLRSGHIMPGTVMSKHCEGWT